MATVVTHELESDRLTYMARRIADKIRRGLPFEPLSLDDLAEILENVWIGPEEDYSIQYGDHIGGGDGCAGLATQEALKPERMLAAVR